jgi:hypothetical protein
MRNNAARLRANDLVAARVSEILEKAAARVEVSVAVIMDELRLRRHPKGREVAWFVVASGDLGSDTTAAIAEICSSPTGGLRIKFHNKKDALVALAALKRAAEEETPADQRDPAADEVPRSTGADHLAGSARRYAAGLQVIQGGAASKPTGTR